jgi:lipopolysaccharide/colanic/teichoic acid biosynthesis glycosyltransferase
MSTSRTSYTVSKRLFDVAGAALLLLILSPLLALVAAAIWLDDGRPVFFTQERAGRHGTLFHILKFRTLAPGPKDPTRPAAHTTRVGAPLRRWAIDELPQLWNVLRGDMSLVGPRPALPRQVQKYTPRQRTRLQVRPGLTGCAQVQGRNVLSWPERIRHDIWYIRHRGFWLDLKILGCTPLVLIRGIGVYGPDGRNPTVHPPGSDSAHV